MKVDRNKPKQPARVCEVPGMKLKDNRHVYVEALPNEPRSETEAVAMRFMRGLRSTMSQQGVGVHHTESGIILPN